MLNILRKHLGVGEAQLETLQTRGS
jgi:hypothetical protein